MGCLVFRSKLKAMEDMQIKRKILLIGLDGAGKTTILYQLKLEKYISTVPTIGLNVETIQYKNLDLMVFDLGGSVTSLWSYYFDNVDAIIFVIDSSDKDRIGQVRAELKTVIQGVKSQKCVFLFYLNKQDLPSVMDEAYILENAGIVSEAEGDIIVQKCSALKNIGVTDGLEKLFNYFVYEAKTRKVWQQHREILWQNPGKVEADSCFC
eukprot:TRINITY_DN11628_c0_g1_i2.p1 TRINITY_DN11628_c0_g1~~TRINITY_DN11628_c0_g1_i2.p1  ORF type:complete len:209 (-),score=19.65 TRINITY_DN11628_c0_g1_i2:189-815(-)